jgi:hypothetical protein
VTLLNDDPFHVLRYVAGPPVLKNDCGVLVTRDINGFSDTGSRKLMD